MAPTPDYLRHYGANTIVGAPERVRFFESIDSVERRKPVAVIYAEVNREGFPPFYHEARVNRTEIEIASVDPRDAYWRMVAELRTDAILAAREKWIADGYLDEGVWRFGQEGE